MKSISGSPPPSLCRCRSAPTGCESPRRTGSRPARAGTAPGWRCVAAAALIATLAAGAPAKADDAGTVVLLPQGQGAAWDEVRRLAPWAQPREYDAAAAVIQRGPGDVVVMYSERAADEMRRHGVLAKANVERRLVFVFVKDLEALLRLPRGTRVFQVALGRVVAHELEHIRRGAAGHDEHGRFVACLGREDLLSAWFATR